MLTSLIEQPTVSKYFRNNERELNPLSVAVRVGRQGRRVDHDALA